MICDSPDSPHSNFQPYTSLTLLRLSLDAPYLFRLEPRASELRCSLADFTQIISWCRSRFLFSWKRRRFVYAVASIEDLQTPRSPTSSKGPSPLFIRLQPFLKIIKIRSKCFLMSWRFTTTRTIFHEKHRHIRHTQFVAPLMFDFDGKAMQGTGDSLPECMYSTLTLSIPFCWWIHTLLRSINYIL